MLLSVAPLPSLLSWGPEKNVLRQHESLCKAAKHFNLWMGDSRACGSTFITPHAWQCVRGAWYTHSGCVCVLVGTDDVCQLLIPLLCDYCSMGNVHECRCPFQQVPLHSNRIKVDVGHSCGNMLWAGLSKWWGAAERSVAGCGCSRKHRCFGWCWQGWLTPLQKTSACMLHHTLLCSCSLIRMKNELLLSFLRHYQLYHPAL